MQTDIPELLNAIPDPQGIRILVRIDLEEQGTIDGQLELLFSFLFGLYHIRDFTKLVHCIYSDRSEMNTPFPYFAVDKERVYLMNRSCDKAVSVQQRDVADAYASFFIALACQHYAYLEEHASLEDFMGAIHRRFIDNSGDDKINRMVERRLCIFKVVNDDLINRYADESIRELLQSYLSMFQRMQSVFLNSASALQEFRKDHSVMENGIEITIDPEDAEKLCQYAGTSEVKDILLLHDEQDHLPRNWTFALFSTGELMILPNWDYHQIISIRDPKIYHAFSVWFDVNHDLAVVREKLTVALHS